MSAVSDLARRWTVHSLKRGLYSIQRITLAPDIRGSYVWELAELIQPLTNFEADLGNRS